MNDPVPLSDVLLRQSRAWQRGEPVSIEALLARYPHLVGDDNATLDLIYSGVALRGRPANPPPPPVSVPLSPRLEAELKLQFEVDQALTIDDPATLATSNGAQAARTAPADWLHGLELLEEVGRG